MFNVTPAWNMTDSRTSVSYVISQINKLVYPKSLFGGMHRTIHEVDKIHLCVLWSAGNKEKGISHLKVTYFCQDNDCLVCDWE